MDGLRKTEEAQLSLVNNCKKDKGKEEWKEAQLLEWDVINEDCCVMMSKKRLDQSLGEPEVLIQPDHTSNHHLQDDLDAPLLVMQLVDNGCAPRASRCLLTIGHPISAAYQSASILRAARRPGVARH